MIKMFIFTYLLGAILLTGQCDGVINVALKEYQKNIFMVGLNKIKLINTSNSNKSEQKRYSLIILLWQMFWGIFLILLPCLLKLLNIVVPCGIIGYLCELYILMFSYIEEIFWIGAIIIAIDFAYGLIKNKI